MVGNIYNLSVKNNPHYIILKPGFNYNYRDLLRGKYHDVEKWEFKVIKGKKEYDIVPLADPANYAISDRFKNILVENKIRGWKSIKLNVINVKNTYHLLIVMGLIGRVIDPKEEGFYVGGKVVEEEWDGVDIFMPSETDMKLFNEKTYNALINQELTNLYIRDFGKMELYSSGC